MNTKTAEAKKEDGSATEFKAEEKAISEVMEQKGVEEDVSDDSPKSRREEIAAKFAKEQRGYDGEEEVEDEADDKDKDDDSERSKDVESTDDELPDDDTKADEPDEESEIMVQVKINGRTRDVEKSKIDAVGGVTNYQKIVAADEQFREAAENRKILDEQAEALQRMEAELAEREKALSKGRAQDTDEPPLSGVQIKEVREQAKKYREALFNGDEDAADEALANLMATKQDASTGNNVDEIIETAAGRAIQVIEQQRYRQELTQAVESFNKEYQDITADPRLYQMADAESAIVKKEHPNWTPEQILTEAGERIRTWHGKDIKKPEPVNTSIADKKAEKQRLSNVKAGTVRQPAPQGKPKTISNSEYITNLRKQRGLE